MRQWVNLFIDQHNKEIIPKLTVPNDHYFIYTRFKRKIFSLIPKSFITVHFFLSFIGCTYNQIKAMHIWGDIDMI
jgi:hypothetical protein